MRKLTKREMVLIYFLMMLVICCVGYYLMVLPANARRTEADSELNVALSDKATSDTILQMEPTLQDTYQKWKNYYLENKDIYGPVEGTSYIEQKVFSYLKQCGMTPMGSSLAEPSQLTLRLEGTDSTGNIYMSSMELTAVGNWNQLQQFTQLCYERKNLRLVSYSLEDLDADPDPDPDAEPAPKPSIENRNYGITLTLEYYMMPKEQSAEDIVQGDGVHAEK